MNSKQNKLRYILALTLWCCMVLLSSLSSSALAAGISVTYYHNDIVGSPVAVTDEDGELLWRKSYQPYGSEIESAPDGTEAEEEFIGYTGHRLDKEIGLVYAGARYYDPVIGRFMGFDPAGVREHIESNPQLFNRYAYGNNNPYKYVDPDGELPILIPAAVFVAKEVGAEIASRATNGATDFLSARRLGTKAIKHGAKLFKRSGSDVAKGAGKGLETRGVRPGPGERTIQGQVDAATKAGKPTIQRGGQDLFRLRSSGHGQSGATATPQNVFRTNPKTGERFGPQAGPDRAVTPRDIRELHKAQTGQGTSTIRTRSGR